MTRTFKLSLIFFISILSLTVMRVLSSFLSLPSNYHSWLFSFVIQVVCLGVLPFVLYKILLKGDIKAYAKDTFIKAKINPMYFAVAFVLGLLVFLLNLIFSNLMHNFLTLIGFTYISGVGTIYSSPEVLIMEVLTVAILPAVFEEIADRGLLLSALENEKNEGRKIFLVGLLFGLAHQNITQFGTALLVGFLLAYLTLRCKSILPAIIVHFLNNFLIVMLNFSDQRSGWFIGILNNFLNFAFGNFILGLLIVGALGGLLVLCIKMFKELGVRSEGGRIQDSGASKNKLDLAFIYLSIALSAVTTIFTFVWGVLR